jgi:hypothetical protein
VNEKALAHWGGFAPKTYKTNNIFRAGIIYMVIRGPSDLFMEFRFNFLTSLVTINYPHAVVTQLCRRIGIFVFII